MRILSICDEVPSPYSAAGREYQLLRRLSRHHQITLLALTRQRSLSSDTLNAAQSCADRTIVLGHATGEEPAFIRWAAYLPKIGSRLEAVLRRSHAVRRMSETMQRVLAASEFDVVLFSSKANVRALPSLLHLPVIVDICDTEHVRIRGEMAYASLLRRAWLLLQYVRLKGIEKTLVNATRHLSFISARDREAMQGAAGGGEIVSVGVDHEYWRRAGTPREDTLVFVGSMDYAPNRDAALLLGDRILPLVQQALPNTKLLLVGRNPRPELLRRAKSWRNVTVTGTVPDVRPYLDQATIFVAPIRFASGTQNKVLEAMAMGVPVVTTSIVADGLLARPDYPPPVFIQNDVESFAAAVLQLFAASDIRGTMAVEGRRFVTTCFDWDRSAATLENLCEKAASVKPTVQV